MSRTPGDWVAWYKFSDDGVIVEAGVDNADGSVIVAVTTSEDFVPDNVAEFNAAVVADTNLLAASPSLLTAAEAMLAYYGTRQQTRPSKEERDLIAVLKAAVRKAKGGLL